MKKLFVIPILCLLFACEEQGVLTRDAANTTINQGAVLKYHGTFVSTSGILVTGEAKIYLENNQYKVVLDNFMLSSGPDLKVYLSKAATPTNFVSLGNLTSQTVYSIPTSINIAEYSHVLIHCQQYNHLFAIATLTSN